MELEKAVKALPNVVVPPFEQLTIGPRQSELRYFRKVDEAEGRTIANAIEATGLAVRLKYVPGHETSERIRPRHFEFWLAPQTAS